MLQSFFDKKFLDERHEVPFELDLTIHFVDLAVNCFAHSRLNHLMQIRFQLPDVAFDELQFCYATLTAEGDGEIHWQHEVPGARNEVGKFAVLSWIWWCPTRRILRLHFWLGDCIVADQLLHVLPFRWIVDHFNIGMVFDALVNFR